MATGTRKDARGRRKDSEGGGSDQKLFNKCLSLFKRNDRDPNAVSHTGLNKPPAAGDSHGVGPVNPARQRVDGRKLSPRGVKRDAGKTLTVSRLTRGTPDGPASRKPSTPESWAHNATGPPSRRNHYSEWPVGRRNTSRPENEILVSVRDVNRIRNSSRHSNLEPCVNETVNQRGELSSDPRSEHQTEPRSNKCAVCKKCARCQRSPIKSYSTTRGNCCVFPSGLSRAERVYCDENCELMVKDYRDSEVFEDNFRPEQDGPKVFSEQEIARSRVIVVGTKAALRDEDGSDHGLPERDKNESCRTSSLVEHHGSRTSITGHVQDAISPPDPVPSMKSAKIGQLTPIADRSRGIDPPIGAVQPPPTAQRAWLCGAGCDDRNLSAGDGGRHCFGENGKREPGAPGEETDGGVNPLPRVAVKIAEVTESPAEPPVEISGDATAAKQLPLAVRALCQNGDRENIRPRLSAIRSGANDSGGKTNIGTGAEGGGCDVLGRGAADSDDRECRIQSAGGGGDGTQRIPEARRGQQVGSCGDDDGGRHYPSQAPLNRERRSEGVAFRAGRQHDDNVNNLLHGKGRDADVVCEIDKDPGRHERTGNVGGELCLRCDSLVDRTAGPVARCERHPEMTQTEPNPSTVYANYSNDVTSDSSSEELHVCACHMKPGKQILAVNPRDLHQNRLSHQYLNSSVTGQTYPDVLPDAQKRYPFFFTDTGLIDAPDFQSSMIFSATPTKDLATSEKPGGGKVGLSGSPAHHYYNKSSVFKPIALDNYTGIPANGDTSFKIFQQPDGTAAVANTGEKDLDLSLFPPLSQLKCPFHKSSPMGTPQHHRAPVPKHHHNHQSHEHQQLLGHLQAQATGYLFRQHYPPCHRPPQGHRSTGDPSLVHHFTCGHRQIRISPVSLLWTFLSVLVAGTCLVSFLTPYWATHPDHVHSFGLFNLCVRDQRFSHPRPLCVNFGYQQMYSHESGANATEVDVVDTRTVDITRIPSGAWQAACLLFGAGVTVQILGALTSLVVLGLTEPWHHRVALVNGYMQTVGVLLLLSGLLLYPVGFSSPFFSYYCDSTRAFCTGHCAMGWSYVTAVMATALSIFCPVMSSFAEAQQTTKKSTVTADTSSA